jgi:hypothetical protein
MISKDREKIRDSFNKIKDDENNIHLKNKLLSICPQETQISKFQEIKFKKKLSIINAILNRKLFKKKITKIPKSEKIVFYNFLENSLTDKNLLHSHSIMRIPRKFLHMLKEIFKLLIDIVKEKFQFDVSIIYKRNAIKYCTKNFDENNDRFYVC